MARDYYQILGVSNKASEQEIKRAYRKLARELHPDINPDEQAQALFAEISTAYEVLSDPQKRRIVDLGGDPLSNGGGGGGGFAGGGFGNLGDVFEAFFGGGGGATRGRPRGRVQPGKDSLLRTKLTLGECATGVTKHITVETAVLCDRCTGSGSRDGSKPVLCTTCGGSGEIQSIQRAFIGNVMTTRPCHVCSGAGETIPSPCDKCGGDGRMRARRDIAAKVPAGVAGGMRVRLQAQGEVGPGGGPAGDLYVEVVEQAHESFIRNGDDLHCTVRVPMIDAALGTSLTIDSILDGQTEVAVKAGTQPGEVLTLRGHGMPKLHNTIRGDLHIHMDVVVPNKLDHKQSELLRDLKALRDRDQAELVSTQAAQGSGLFSRLRSTLGGR